MTIRYPSATITWDYLWVGGDPFEDEVGKTWLLGTQVVEVRPQPLTAYAYDDDGERYYRLSVILPVDDEEQALGNLLSVLGRNAGVTDVRFPNHKELDIG